MTELGRSVIFFSTPTSGNGSMFRAISTLAEGSLEAVRWVDDLYKAGRIQDVALLSPPPHGALIKHNAPERFNPATRLSHYRFILNARDPRDMVCNQYHWQFSHPVLNEMPEQTAQRRASVAQEGIDAFVLRHDNGPYLKGFVDAARRIAPPDRIFIGYAMYCLHFEEVMARLSDFLAIPLASIPARNRRRIGRERVENLATNRHWVGQRWAGADTAPGRHRHELRPETIAELTRRYSGFIDFLRRMDDPRVTHTYD